MFHEENGAVVAGFLERQPDARRVAAPGIEAGQLLPDADHDGFYYALLQKNA